jgi:dihydrofolate reductase
MIVSLIGAVSENGGIGLDGGIPWHLPADLKLFKQTTMDHHLILGRLTYESIGKPLRGRQMVVVTRQPDYHAAGCAVVHSLEEALALARKNGETEAFIGGGAQLYEIALPLADRIYLTRVHAEVEADTFFPPYNESDWVVIDQVDHAADERSPYAFTFLTLERRK